MGDVIPFRKLLDRRRRALVRARTGGAEMGGRVLGLHVLGASAAEQAPYARYFEGVVDYFETGRPPALAR